MFATICACIAVAGSSWAQTSPPPDDPSCAAYRTQWNEVASTHDLTVMDRALTTIPRECEQLRIEASIERQHAGAPVNLVRHFIAAHILELLFGLVASITSIAALYFAAKSYRISQGKALNPTFGSVNLFLSRDAMVEQLFGMYERAKDGDTIWAQTVSMRNYKGDVRGVVLGAAGRGIKFRMILNRSASGAEEFATLFGQIRSAELALADDNKVRIQGLSEREVIIAIPSLTGYIALRISDSDVVRIFKSWFDDRFDQLTKRAA